ncbi:VanZ family protein [Salininema proteolyticum]|uniref:VanZ family protein n=1 Tax=Salininema proteolyticum TaxID=1607685 RepID=A0ABV8U195_9ACTN
MLLPWQRFALLAAALALPAIAAGTFLNARRRRRAGSLEPVYRHALAETAALAGTLPFVAMILTPTSAEGGVSLVPFADLAALRFTEPGFAAVQVVGNLLAFAALGAALPVRFALRAWQVAAIAAAASVSVEVLQFALRLGRITSVDDVLVNTAGAVAASCLTLPWWRAAGLSTVESRS